MSKKEDPNFRPIAQNKKARHDYLVLETFEAGLVLFGSEVKSLREGRVSLNESYAGEREGALYLLNTNISEYPGANRFNHEPRRPRKLLLHKREFAKIFSRIKQDGMTLIPLSMYFNHKGIVKVQLGLCKGKQKGDKRAAEKEKEWRKDRKQIIDG